MNQSIPKQRFQRLSLRRVLTAAWKTIPVFIVLSAGLLITLPANAQDPEKDLIKPEEVGTKLAGPFIEETPFDLITLDDDNDNIIMRIEPLPNPPQQPFPDRGLLVFDFRHESVNKYQVPWDHVVRYQSYQDLLIDEANRWLQAGDYSRAFRNLLYVYDREGKSNDEIVTSLLDCLYLDGRDNFQNERFELALSIFEDVYQKDPDFRIKGINKKLALIIMDCYDGILTKNFDGQNVLRVRGLLEKIRKKYPEASLSLIESWRNRFAQRSDELIANAYRFAANGEGVKAHDSVRMANNIFPGRTENTEAYNDVVGQFPLIFVGVSQDGGDANPTRMDHWGARRVGRLTQRTIVEFVGLSDEGGKYKFLPGFMSQVDDAGLQFRLSINPSNETFAVPDSSAADIAWRLQSHADPESVFYNVPWARIAGPIGIDNSSEITLTLKTPFVRPEAYFQIPFQARGEDGQPIQDGAYRMVATNDDLTLFQVNPTYTTGPGSTEKQHPDIYERKFSSASAAVDALIKGDIDVVDRIPVQDLARLKRYPEIKTHQYAVPTVHMLVPNQRNEFMADPNFRNGLLHAINRELIVRENLCGGREISGCQVISGPFPIGTDDNDQLAYGYNTKVRNTEYNYKLGSVLSQLIVETMKSKRIEKGEKDPQIEKPQIVLAHPTDDTTMLAVRAIERGWREIGIRIHLKPIPDGGTLPVDEDWDFLYMSLAMQEPVTDAMLLFGGGGYVDTIDDATRQAIQQLGTVRSWQKGCLKLRQIHRQVATTLSILPLWQMNEYYAHRQTVKEVGGGAVHLYQNVERWRIAPIMIEQDQNDPEP